MRQFLVLILHAVLDRSAPTASLPASAKDPLADIANAMKIGAVMKNGRLYDPMTLDEIWPDPRKRPAAWFHGDDAAPTAP